MLESKISPGDLPKLKKCWENLSVELNNLPGAKNKCKGMEICEYIFIKTSECICI